jgi:hypothetical protein
MDGWMDGWMDGLKIASKHIISLYLLLFLFKEDFVISAWAFFLVQ